MFDAYTSILKCYSFRTIISDFYIDDLYTNIPNFDSVGLIHCISNIISDKKYEIAYDLDENALPFRKIIHEYLVSVNDDTSCNM